MTKPALTAIVSAAAVAGDASSFPDPSFPLDDLVSASLTITTADDADRFNAREYAFVFTNGEWWRCEVIYCLFQEERELEW